MVMTTIFGCINIDTESPDYGKEEVIEFEENCIMEGMKFSTTDQKCNIYRIGDNKYAVEILDFNIEVIGSFRNCHFIMERCKRSKKERFEFSNAVWKDDKIEYDEIAGIEMDETDLILKGYAWTASYGKNIKVFENGDTEDMYLVSDAVIPGLDLVIHIPEEQIRLSIFPKIMKELAYTFNYEHY